MSDRRAGSDRTIFVNRRAVMLSASTMTGAEIAELIGVPRDNAVIERQTADGLVMLALDDEVTVDGGETFLVTRQFIMGGCDDYPRYGASPR